MDKLKSEAGYTLIEVGVFLLLLAVAVAIFFGAR